MQWKINQEESGKRLDILLRDRLPHLGRAGVKRLLVSKAIKVDGKFPLKSWLLRAEQLVEVDDGLIGLSPQLAESTLEKALLIVQETSNLLVLNKPAGLASVSLKGSATPSVAQWLSRHYPQMTNIGYGPLEAGLIHRLDTYTSGLILAAKTPEAFKTLTAALKNHHLEKTYLALTTQVPTQASGTICTSLDARGKGRVQVGPSRSDSSFVSAYKTLGSVTAYQGDYALHLIEVKAHAAYRHQVRAHLAHLGAPLLGDTLYGGQEYELAPRHALACTEVKFSGELENIFQLQVQADLASDLAGLGDFASLLAR